LERASKELREHQAKLADIFSKMTSLQNQLEKQKSVHKKCLEDKKVLDAKVDVWQYCDLFLKL
jgi:DNA repair exonuclease SbcCD ATPase subunit